MKLDKFSGASTLCISNDFQHYQLWFRKLFKKLVYVMTVFAQFGIFEYVGTSAEF